MEYLLTPGIASTGSTTPLPYLTKIGATKLDGSSLVSLTSCLMPSVLLSRLSLTSDPPLSIIPFAQPLYLADYGVECVESRNDGVGEAVLLCCRSGHGPD